MLKRIVEFDESLSARVRVAERPGLLRSLAAFLAHSGDSWFWLLGLGVLWLVGGDFWRRRVGVLALGVLVTAAVVMAIKLMVKRRRPEGEWGGIYRSTDPHSFPSGHAVRAVMLAVLAMGLGPAWFAVILVAWAPLVALARVSMGLHYLSDVVAGVVLGALMGVVLGLFFW